MSELLLKEYLHEIICEDDTGAVWGDLHSHDMMMHPYGVRFGSGHDLFNIFVKPFVDVFDTTVGKTKELSVKVQTLAKVAFETIVTTLVPIFSDSYKKIFADEKKHIDKIREEYKEVYQSNWDAFRDNDAFWTAFCYAPWAIITIKLIKHSPKTAGHMISTLTGGKADRILGRMLGDWRGNGMSPRTGLGVGGWRDGHGHMHGGYGETMGMGFGGSDGGMGMESLVREDSDKDNARLVHAAKVLASPEFLEKLKTSPIVKDMQRKASTAVRTSLAAVYKEAQAVMSARSLHELQQKTGKRIKDLDTFNKIPQAERQRAEAQLLEGFRKTMKNFYSKNLDGQVEAARRAGVTDDSPYIQDYQRIIARIKAL